MDPTMQQAVSEPAAEETNGLAVTPDPDTAPAETPTTPQVG